MDIQPLSRTQLEGVNSFPLATRLWLFRHGKSEGVALYRGKIVASGQLRASYPEIWLLFIQAHVREQDSRTLNKKWE